MHRAIVDSLGPLVDYMHASISCSYPASVCRRHVDSCSMGLRAAIERFAVINQVLGSVHTRALEWSN